MFLGEINTGSWSSKIETIKYGREYFGTHTQERLPWRSPATTENCRPYLSLERVRHVNTVIV
jgi:hypothetical protein